MDDGHSRKNRIKAGALSFMMASLFCFGFIAPSIGCMGDGINGWIIAGVGCWAALGLIAVCFRDWTDTIFKNGAD